MSKPSRPVLLPLLAVLLAAAAVAVHVLGWGEASKDADMRQGAYRPLVRAEADLAVGRAGPALAAYQTAAMRAVRFGRLEAFERIRRRVGRAGFELAASGDRAGAWPLLARFALWSPDFDRTSRGIESRLLGRAGWGPEFAYPLVLKDGRTAWNQKADWVSLWVPETWLSPEKRELLKGYTAVKSPVAPGSKTRFVLYGLGLARATQDAGTALRLTGGGSYRWFPRLGGVIEWDAPFPAGPPPPKEPWERRDLSLLSLVGVGDGPAPPAVLELVHVYRAL